MENSQIQLAALFSWLSSYQGSCDTSEGENLISVVRHHINSEYTEEEAHQPDWLDLSDEAYDIAALLDSRYRDCIGPCIERELASGPGGSHLTSRYFGWLLLASRKINYSGDAFVARVAEWQANPTRSFRWQVLLHLATVPADAKVLDLLLWSLQNDPSILHKGFALNAYQKAKAVLDRQRKS